MCSMDCEFVSELCPMFKSRDNISEIPVIFTIKIVVYNFSFVTRQYTEF